jgi:iron(II)-dependent oxidoreductase
MWHEEELMTQTPVQTWWNVLVGAGLVALLLLRGWWYPAPWAALAQERSPFPGMVAIPGGKFTMGRDNGPLNEQPAHQLSLPTFYIDRDLVTVAEFAIFIQVKGPQGLHGEMYLDVYDSDNRIRQRDSAWIPDKGFEHYPVGEVSWHGALAYCQWRKKRLPTEAEWEKAARGTDARLYPWGNEAPRPDLAFFGAMRGQTVPVGQYPKGGQPLWGS